MIARTAGMDVVDKINNEFKFDYIRDMDRDMLAKWHVEQGLSLIELAMVRLKFRAKVPPAALTGILFQK